ncbi:LPS-assembly protein LptD [Marinomonas sp.]|jgi:LPS-assembly protein|uniref:LPS-assembly protein LptD n=1 Tax=Marinomonas sp. TaxID=1904862 RepID=UPI003F98BC50
MVKHSRIYALFFQSLFILPAAHANQWDWVPRESLPAEQQAQLGRYCQGSYIDQWKSPNSEDTNLKADLIYRDENGVVHLNGAAEIIQPTSSLQADNIEGVPDKYYKTDGNVILRQKGQMIRGSSGYVSNSTDSPTEFVDAKFINLESGQRGAAKSLLRSKNGIIFIHQGYYTTCEPTEESWQLYGTAIELNPQEGFGTAENVQIRIHDVPVFYFPWLRFPLNNARQTGFLFPTFGVSGSKGISVSAPFYWNIAPNYDATITPNYIQEEGSGFDLELRHLGDYDETTFEQSTFEDNDEGEQIVRKFKTDLTFNKYFSSGLLLEDNPTEDKYPDANTTSIGEEDNYERSGYLSFNNGNFSSKATVRRYQTPDPDEDKPFEWLPRIESSYRYATGLFDYSVDMQYTDFNNPDPDVTDDDDNFDGQRTVLNQDLSLSFSNAWGSFTPGVLIQNRDYSIHDYTDDSDYDTSLNHVSTYFDTKTVFERSITNGDKTWRQTLEPRLSFLDSPYTDQTDIVDFDASTSVMSYSQAFSHERFSGNDRIGDTRQFTLGVESRLYDENNNERWAFKLGQIQYLKDRFVSTSGDTDSDTPVDDDSTSPLLGSVTYTGSDRFSLTANANYDIGGRDTTMTQVIVKLKPVDEVKVNLSYLYSIDNDDEDDDTNQSNIGTIFPINQNWSMFLQHTYDFFDNRSTKEVAGLGYENCCVKVSASYQHWLNDDSEFESGFFLQFTLRSLSSPGAKDNSTSSIADEYWNEGKVGY